MHMIGYKSTISGMFLVLFFESPAPIPLPTTPPPLCLSVFVLGFDLFGINHLFNDVLFN